MCIRDRIEGGGEMLGQRNWAEVNGENKPAEGQREFFGGWGARGLVCRKSRVRPEMQRRGRWGARHVPDTWGVKAGF